MRQRFKAVRLRPAVPADADVILWLEEVCMKAYAKALWGKLDNSERTGQETVEVLLETVFECLNRSN